MFFSIHFIFEFLNLLNILILFFLTCLLLVLNLLQLLKLEKVHPYFVWGSFFFVCFLKELFSTSLLSLVNIFLCLGFILTYFRETFFFVCFLEGLCSTNILFNIYFVVCYNNKLYTWVNFLCLTLVFQ